MINHITLNPSGTRYIMLVRNFKPAPEMRWTTTLLLGDLEGNIKMLVPYGMVSHYHFKDDDTMVLYTNINGEGGTHYVLNTVTGDYTRLDHYYLINDLHCLWSHDKKFFIGDGYPGKYPRRKLCAYRFETGELIDLLWDPSPTFANTDIRCDLHNRFNVKGDKISFDSIRNGRREILEMDMTEFFKTYE